MAETLFVAMAVLALVGGCTLVAVVATTALGMVIARLEVALGTSMLLMGTLLYALGGSAWQVVGLVGLSHALAGALIWQKNRLRRK
ncbi:MAG: hypothetical protein N3D18_06705 [Roseococcus sp.]|nr:hypothetical protein [Roseococcus sp.]